MTPDADGGLSIAFVGAGGSGGYAHGYVLVTAVNDVAVGRSFTSWCRAVASLPAGKATLSMIRRPGGPAPR